MNVAVIGDFAGAADEGLKVASKRLAALAGAWANVTTIDLREAVSVQGARRIRGCKPDIVHVVAGPSPKAAAVFQILRLAVPRAKRLLTAMHPLRLPTFWRLASGARPHVTLGQSNGTVRTVKLLGGKASLLPVGVDTRRFAPSPGRDETRAKHGWSGDRVLLHVGHLKRDRGLERLREAREAGWKAALVVSTSTRPDPDLRNELGAAGVDIIEGYQPAIEALYGGADAYVFPTTRTTDAVETPLSVLEAMATNLPIVTTRYPGIPDLFEEGDGLAFLGESDPMAAALERATKVPTKTRSKLLGATVLHEPTDLERVYRSALAED